MSDRDQRLQTSHDLWSAKAVARLSAQLSLQSTLHRLFREGQISTDTMLDISDCITACNREEEESTAEAETRYAEAWGHE